MGKKDLEKEFWKCGLEIMDRKHLYSPEEPIDITSTSWRHFRSFFGASPGVCADAWTLLERHTDIGSGQKLGFMWGLMILKIYTIENVLSKITGADEKTVRKWGWHFISLLDGIDYLVVSHLLCYVKFLFSF